MTSNDTMCNEDRKPCKAIDVAQYLLLKASTEAGEAAKASNLKIQKLLYYVQGFSLVLLGRPAFEDEMEAWMHGPVVPEVYHALKDHGSNDIKPDVKDARETCVDEELAELIDEVFSVYAKHSAWHLRNLTHEEDPWLNRYAKDRQSEKITHDDLIAFFPSLLA